MTNYRIFRFSGLNYPAALDQIMAEAAKSGNYDYNFILKAYFRAGSIYSDSFKRVMSDLGNEAHEFIFNHERIQRLWAAEHGLSVSDADWRYQIAEAQIRVYAPDVVYIQGANDDPACAFVPRPDFRERCPSVKLVVGYSGFPVNGRRLRMLDLMLAGSPLIRDTYREAGLRTELTYHGVDGRIPEHLAAWREAGNGGRDVIDFSFTGSSGFGYGEHRGRYWTLLSLIAQTDLDLWLDERPDIRMAPEYEAELDRFAKAIRANLGQIPPSRFARVVAQAHTAAFGNDASRLRLAQIFPERCRPPVYGLEMFDILARSRVTFNKHTDAARGYVANIRLFEATAVGACLLTDDGINMRDLFEPGVEVVTYSGVEDCLEKLAWLRDHETERRAIAEAGRRRTLRDHTMDQRVTQIDHHISAALANRIS